MPSINRESILAAALRIIDHDGLGSFKMETLAKDMGITTPSLYYYYSNKADLLRAVSNYIFGEVQSRIGRRRGEWMDAMIAVCVDARRAMLKHPNAAPLLLTYPPRHIMLEGYEWGLRLMKKADVPLEIRLQISLGLEKMTWGEALIAAAAHSKGLNTFPSYNPSDFPALAEARSANRRSDEALFRSDCLAYLRGCLSEGAQKA